MLTQLGFFASIAFSFIAWGIVANRYIWPELRLRQRAEALRPLLVLHSFRFMGLAFLVPGVVSPDLPPAFAHSRHCHRMDLQSLGLGRSPERFLSGQCDRAVAGAAGSRLLHSDFRCAAAADHARTGFPDSSATSK